MTIRRRSLLAGTAALPIFAAHTAVAQTALTIQIAASHPVQNFWIHIMKNVFQPEVDKFLRDNGNTHRINWREAYGGTLYRFQDTMEAVRDNITDIGYVGTEGFDADSAEVITRLVRQSQDISQGVTVGEGLHEDQGDQGDQGAGRRHTGNHTHDPTLCT